MKYKTRKKLFWFFTFLFLLIGSILVVYSFGYRLDTKKLEFVQTGGLYIKTSPKISDIHIDGEKLEKTPNLLTSGIFVQSLNPGVHKVTASKKDYLSWTKDVDIQSKMVSSFSNVLLLPSLPDVKDFYQPEEGETLLDFRKIKNQALIEVKLKEGTKYFQVLKLINPKGDVIDIFNKKIGRYDKFNVAKDVIFNEETKQVIIPFYGKSKSPTFYLWDELESEEITNLSTLLAKYFPSGINKIVFHPFNQDQYLVQTKERLGVLDLNKESVVYLPIEKMIDFGLSSTYIFWLDESGSVYSYNLISNNVSFLSELEEEDLEGMKIVSSLNSKHLAILSESGSLTLVSVDSGNIPLSDSVLKFSFSFDNKKLAYIKKNKEGELEARIHFLKDINALEKKVHDEVVLKMTQEADSLADFKWFEDSNHLITAFVDGRLNVFEIDDRGGINNFEYDFQSGGFVIQESGLIFKVTPELVEKINLMVVGTNNIEKESQ